MLSEAGRSGKIVRLITRGPGARRPVPRQQRVRSVVFGWAGVDASRYVGELCHGADDVQLGALDERHGNGKRSVRGPLWGTPKRSSKARLVLIHQKIGSPTTDVVGWKAENWSRCTNESSRTNSGIHMLHLHYTTSP